MTAESEWNLSDKINIDMSGPYGKSEMSDFIFKEDVREFIKRLKEDLKFWWSIQEDEGDFTLQTCYDQIDKIAGDKLC